MIDKPIEIQWYKLPWMTLVFYVHVEPMRMHLCRGSPITCFPLLASKLVSACMCLPLWWNHSLSVWVLQAPRRQVVFTGYFHSAPGNCYWRGTPINVVPLVKQEVGQFPMVLLLAWREGRESTVCGFSQAKGMMEPCLYTREDHLLAIFTLYTAPGTFKLVTLKWLILVSARTHGYVLEKIPDEHTKGRSCSKDSISAVDTTRSTYMVSRWFAFYLV